MAGVAALAVVWIVVTAFLARRQLTTLEARLGQVRQLVAAGRVSDAQALAQDIPAMAEHAHRLTTGPAWWVASGVPYLGDPLDVARGTTEAADQVSGHAIPALLDVATLIDPNRLRVGGNRIRIAPLEQALPRLQQASASFRDASTQLSGLPSDTWLPQINSGRDRLVEQFGVVGGYVDAAVRAAKVLPTMLAANGTQTYFVGLQNEAELRGTGGLPGAFAIVQTHQGTITFTRFESDTILLPTAKRPKIKTGLDFGPSYDALYGASEPTTSFPDSNVSPHFPYTARIWAAMWQKVSGEHVDGVVAVDPTVLANFLLATGPTPLPGGGVVTAANVVSLTQRDNYTLFPDNQQRKDFLVAILKAASHRITSGVGNPLNLVRAASASASEQRFLVWSEHPAIQKLIEQTNYSGAIPTTNRPFAGLVLNNAGAGKLDYYLTRTIAYQRTGCGPRRDVNVTITLRNDAPASGLPLYVVGRLDHPPKGARPGDSHLILDYYATDGALLQSATLDGKPSTAAVQTELGHTVLRLDVELPRATTQTIVLHLAEPAGRGSPVIWRQPGVVPLQVSSFDQKCS